MVEVRNPYKDIEKIENRGLDLNLIRRKTKSKTFRGYLNGMLQKAKNDKNRDLEVFLSEIIEKFNKFYPERIIPTIEIIDGWKGKDKIEVYRGFDNNMRIREHVKDKYSLEVTERLIEVKKEDLNRIVSIIKNLPLNKPVSCYLIAKKMGYENWKELWKERKQYFQFYYYPIKVLEALKVIDYSGRGKVTRVL